MNIFKSLGDRQILPRPQICLSFSSLVERDEPLYKPDPDHPYETIARYLYMKWGIPKQEIQIGKDVIHRPNLIIVYAIEGTLISSELTWKAIKEQYTIA